MKHSRRDFIKQTAIAGAGIAVMGSNLTNLKASPISNTQFVIPILPYGYDALEPFIDKQTMEIHYSKHHQGYVDKLNKILMEKNMGNVTLTGLLKEISKYETPIRNNAGGHYNHTFFWEMLKPPTTVITSPSGKLIEAINSTWNSFDEFKIKFSDAGKSVFGSGWVWLIINKNEKLEIGTTPNQDNPIMDLSPLQGIPIIGLDLWEHAYYLKHQNKRIDYINNWWNVINWELAEKHFDKK